MNIVKTLELISFIVSNFMVWSGLLLLFAPWYNKIIELKALNPLAVFMFAIIFILSLPFYIFGFFDRFLVSKKHLLAFNILVSTVRHCDIIHDVGHLTHVNNYVTVHLIGNSGLLRLTGPSPT